jgi:hypothetical protein
VLSKSYGKYYIFSGWLTNLWIEVLAATGKTMYKRRALRQILCKITKVTGNTMYTNKSLRQILCPEKSESRNYPLERKWVWKTLRQILCLTKQGYGKDYVFDESLRERLGQTPKVYGKDYPPVAKFGQNPAKSANSGKMVENGQKQGIPYARLERRM